MSPSSSSRRTHARRVIRGLYGLADAGASGGDPERLAAQMLTGGCRLIQLRCKGWGPDRQIEVGRAIQRRCEAVGAAFFVNDHLEIAQAIGATGVHLGQVDGDLPARMNDDTLLIGRSTHSPEQAREAVAQGADYVAFGPVFDTPHLSRHKPIRGADPLPSVRSEIPRDVPLVAIGGIHARHLGALVEVGVDAWAIIGAIALAPDPVAATQRMLAP